MADNFENIAQKEFLLENSPRVELASMQNDIRSSMETQKEVGNLSQFLPKDFNPSNDYFFGKSVASPLKPTLETRNYNIEDAYAQLPSGDYLAKYDTFKSGRDNAEYAAATQTTGEKWANGATKALAKTGSAVIGGTVGLIYGVGAALKDGSFTAIYDNSFSNTLADWDEKLQYQLPNYYSKQEQEKGLFGQMGTANFWSDKFLGGLSFTAGAIISEAIWAYATGGLSLAAEGAILGTRLARAGKWGVEALGETAALQGVTKYKSLYNTMLQGSIDAAKTAKTYANALGKAGELASSIGVLARSAGYEASVEALQYKREAMENFHQNFLAMNGREPNSEELSAFKSNLESSANVVFGANMAILMPSNLVTMGHILDIKSPIKTGFAEFIDKRAFGYGIGKTVDTAGKETFKVLEATTKQKIARTAYNYVLKPAFSEGLFEEGLQGVTTKTANKWIEHTYNPRYANDTLDSMGAFYESLGEQYGTKEGWVENGLGMIIGIVGGATNAKAEQRQKAEELSYQEAVANTLNENFLQRTILPNRVQSASREAGFSEDAKIEAQKGNMNRASLAQQSALLTYVNAKMSLGETVPDIVKSVKMGLDSTTEDQWKEAGISPDQIDNHKEESLKEFEQLAKDWKTNKTYWGYIIGNKIKGEQFLDTQVAEGMFGGVQGAPAIIEALAWQSTIGSSANKQMKEVQDAISKELGLEAASALKTNEKLTAATIQAKRQIHLDTINYKAELKKRDTLVKKIERLNHAPQRPEGRDAESGRQAGILSQSLLETEEKLQNLEAALDEHAKKLSDTEAYQKEIGAVDFSSQDLSTDVIRGSDLISLTDNLKKLTSTLETMKTVNPQRATYLEEMFKEYSDSQEVFLQNQLSQRLVLHPDFKIEQINSWIQSKLKKNAKMNVNTQDWLIDTLETYKRIKTEGLKEQAEVKLGERKEEIQRELDTIEDKNSDRAKELQAELDSYNKSEVEKDKKEVVAKEPEIKEEEPLSSLEVYKKRIEQALQKGHNYLSYLGDNYDDVANKKPTEAEVEEFIKLREQKKFLDPRYKELQQKLSDWKLLDSAVDEDYVSIGDLILAVEQLEQQIEEEETRTEVTPEDTPDISDNESIQASENVTRYDMLQNTNAGITVKRRKNGNFSLHHLKLSNIAQRMGFDPSVDSLVNKEGKGITFGEETSGSILTVDGVEFKVTGGNAIEVKESDFIPLQQRLNMYVLNTGAVKWSYSDVYTQVGDDFVKMESDFRDDSINAERIYDLKEGDRLTITVNNEDGYNDKLLKEYETAKGKAKDEALKKLKANLKLSATTVDGVIENVSTLKAMRAEIDEDFMRLRERAFELYMEAADKNNVKLGIEVTVSGSFLGSPNFTITDNTISNIAITKRASEEIIATGFIENGEFTLNREVKDVNKTYVGQLSKKNKDKKVPVIVFKRGVHSVAFPVTMNKTDNDLSSLFDSILSMKISSQEKVRKINAEIQANKINTPKLVYEDVYDNKKLEDTRKAFSEVKSFVTAEEFADKNYNIENTIKDISINIDLENISSIINSPKLKINLDSSVKYTTDLELKHGSMTDLENEIDKVARELYNDYTKNAQTKYTKANGDIIEDTGYTDTFDDNPIEPATNQLDKIKNINILRTAFEGLTPALKKIIGKENIDRVNEMFKQYDFIKSQLTPKPNTINNGKKASSCP